MESLFTMHPPPARSLTENTAHPLSSRGSTACGRALIALRVRSLPHFGNSRSLEMEIGCPGRTTPRVLPPRQPPRTLFVIRPL
jgi:hypothetical protein